VDDSWCHHFARINNRPFDPGKSMEEYMLGVEKFDFEIMELHRRRIREYVTDPAKADALMPYYRYSCRRPLFHDEYLPALNRPNVTVVDCANGIERVTERGLVINGHEYELDCIVYATGFEPEITPLPRRVGHTVIGLDGLSLAEKFSNGEATLFGLMTSGFPNMFLMPCPGHQAVVTVNYPLLSEISAEYIAATVAALEAADVRAFDVNKKAENEWVAQILAANRQKGNAAPPGGVPCTPGSRMIFDDDGNMVLLEPHGGSYGGGFGDYFGFRDLLTDWLEEGTFAGLDVDRRSP
jgi:cation diffusion facilitator CzcD-associated flavoprotein CzcO